MPKKPTSTWKDPNGLTHISYEKPVRQSSLNKIFIGIDPGQKGGLCAIFGDRIEIAPMPESERDIWSWFTYFANWQFKGGWPKIHAYIEKVHSMPKQGVASSFKFGVGLGFLHGCLHGAGISFETVTPQLWQKTLTIPPKKKSETDGEFKNRLRQHAQRIYPQLEIWSEPRSKGRQLAVCDALLISHYCKLKNQGN